ncbi:hypothetical protein BG004_003374, partial [Podila humilis]
MFSNQSIHRTIVPSASLPEAEGDYRTEHDLGHDQDQFEHGRKRHLQDHWCTSQSGQVSSNQAESKNQQASEKEWVCNACNLPQSDSGSSELTSFPEDMSLTGAQVTKTVKEQYLWTLRKVDLVRLISRIESNTPGLKLYPSRLSSPTHPATDIPPVVHTLDSQKYDFSLNRPPEETSQQPPTANNAPTDQSDYFASHYRSMTGSDNSTRSGSASGPIPTERTAITPFMQHNGVVGTPPHPLSMHTHGPNVLLGSPIEQQKKPVSAIKEPRTEPASNQGITGISNYNPVKALDLPPYEEMIFMAIADLCEEAGSAPKAILDWVHAHYPVPDTFRASCGQAISKAAKKGRLLKDGALYKLKPGYIYPPKRIPRHAGGGRTRSLSYTSGIPLRLQTLGRPMVKKANMLSPVYDHMGIIMDGSAFDAVPSAPFLMTQQQVIVAQNFVPEDMVTSGGDNAQLIKHSFALEKSSLGNTDMVKALAVQPGGLVGTSIPSNDTRALVGLGVTTSQNHNHNQHLQNQLQMQDSTSGSTFSLRPDVTNMHAIIGPSTIPSLHSFSNGLQVFQQNTHVVGQSPTQNVPSQTMQFMQQLPLQQHQAGSQMPQCLQFSTQPHASLNTMSWNFTSGSNTMSLDSLAAISPISTPNQSSSGSRSFQGFPRQNRAMSIQTPLQYHPSMFGDLGPTGSPFVQDAGPYRQTQQRPIPLNLTAGLNMTSPVPTPFNQGPPRARSQFMPLQQQHLPFHNSFSAPSSPLETHMNRANTSIRPVLAGT